MKEIGHLYRNVKGKIEGWIEEDKRRTIEFHQAPLEVVFLTNGILLPEDDASYNWGMSASMSDFVQIIRVVQQLREGDEKARQIDESATERAETAATYLLSLPNYQPTFWKKALFALEANNWDIESVKVANLDTPSQYENEQIEELQDAFLGLGPEVLSPAGIQNGEDLYHAFASFQTNQIDDTYLRELLIFTFTNGYDAPPRSSHLTIAGKKISNIELDEKREIFLKELKESL